MAGPTSDQITAAYMARASGIRDRVVAFAEAIWDGSPTLRDADVDRLVSRIVPVVQGGQIQVANLTNAYVQRLGDVEGVTVAPARVDKDLVVGYRGTPAAEVYRRPAVTAYTALAERKPFEEARTEGLHRLLSIVTTDIQQSRNRQSAAAYEQSGFDYTARELSGRENCALCVIASTQRYRPGDLHPIHPGCDCGQRGIIGDRDTGQVIDPDLLNLTHEQIRSKLGGTDAAALDLGLGKVDPQERPLSDFTDLIITNEHGELGPTLSWRSDMFTSAADITALN